MRCMRKPQHSPAHELPARSIKKLNETPSLLQDHVIREALLKGSSGIPGLYEHGEKDLEMLESSPITFVKQ